VTSHCPEKMTTTKTVVRELLLGPATDPDPGNYTPIPSRTFAYQHTENAEHVLSRISINLGASPTPQYPNTTLVYDWRCVRYYAPVARLSLLHRSGFEFWGATKPSIPLRKRSPPVL
jgi:hypothetical protein